MSPPFSGDVTEPTATVWHE